MAGGKNTKLLLDLNIGFAILCRVKSDGVAAIDFRPIPEELINGIFNGAENNSAGFAAFMRSQGLPGGRNAIAILPAGLGIVNNFVLPAADENEIPAMVDFEASERLPVTGNDWRWSYYRQNSLPNNANNVSAHAVRRDLLQNCLKSLRDAGIEASRVYPFSACVQGFVKSPGSSITKAATAIVVVGEKDISISVANSGIVTYIRSFAPENLREIVNETWLTLDDFSRSNKTKVEKVVVLSSIKYENELPNLLKERLDAETLGIRWEDISFVEFPLGGASEENKLPTGAAAGISMLTTLPGSTAATLDIAPRPSAKQKKKKLGKLLLWAAILAAGASCAYGAATISERNRELAATVGSLENKIESLSPKVERLNEMQAQIGALAEADMEYSSLDSLLELSALVPKEGMKITRFFYDRGNKVSIAGQATDHTKVMALIGALNNSISFRNPHLDFSRRSGEFANQVVEFEVSAEMAKGAATR